MVTKGYPFVSKVTHNRMCHIQALTTGGSTKSNLNLNLNCSESANKTKKKQQRRPTSEDSEHFVGEFKNFFLQNLKPTKKTAIAKPGNQRVINDKKVIQQNSM